MLSNIQDYYLETEVWYILDNIVSAGAYFETNEVSIKDIRPFNILITQAIDYKVVDQSIFGKRALPNYFGLIQGLDAKNPYIAPEIFKSLRSAKQPAFNLYKADVFSLGISLIEASNLETLEKAYDWDKLLFNENIVKEGLAKVRNRYSDNLADILAKMTLVDDNVRPDFLSLDATLNPRRPEIRARLLKKLEVIIV